MNTLNGRSFRTMNKLWKLINKHRVLASFLMTLTILSGLAACGASAPPSASTGNISSESTTASILEEAATPDSNTLAPSSPVSDSLSNNHTATDTITDSADPANNSTDDTTDSSNKATNSSDQATDPTDRIPPSLDEAGSYTTKDDVALYIHTYGKLPSNFITKKEAESLGWSGGSLEPYAPGKCIGGSKFGNYEGHLPEASGRTYYECDIDYEGGYRNAKRIVFSNDGLVFYTGDHYKTFEQLY